MKKQFKLPTNMNDSQLFKLFGQYSRYIMGGYFIDFNGKMFRGDTPIELFDKVKAEYENYLTQNVIA